MNIGWDDFAGPARGTLFAIQKCVISNRYTASQTRYRFLFTVDTCRKKMMDLGIMAFSSCL